MALVLLAAACGGEDADRGGGDGERRTPTAKDGETGLDDAGDPVRGGTIVYGLEAETSGGWCLPEAQLAISGIMVRWAIYDPLTVPNAEGEYVPYLAESVEPNDDYTVWTIGLREGVTFHDGSKLDATVVKNNLDAFRGTYPGRNPLLTTFVLKNIADVVVKDPMTVEIRMASPWVAFPAYLPGFGMMAQAQLDDAETCDRQLIGTGPFKFESWKQDQELIASRNENYWQIAPDGEPYPYADEIRFRPIPDPSQRVNALESGDLTAMLTSTPKDIAGPLIDLAESGEANLYVSEDHAEVNYVMLNNSQAPFDDLRMRKAVAMGLDRETLNEVVNAGLPTIANQPFPEGDPGYVEDPGFPSFDQEGARELVEEYEAEGKEAKFSLSIQAGDPVITQRAELIQQQLQQVGIEVQIVPIEQAALINNAIAGEFQAMTFRQFPGGEPDTLYIWWHSQDNPINFARIADPEIDKALEEARAEPDRERRLELYEDISRRFGEQVYNVWLWYTPWAVAMSPDAHNVLPEELPNGDEPWTGLAGGHPVHGMWLEGS